MQLRYTWASGAPPTLSDYLPTPEAIDEAARTLAEHNRPGSALTIARIECHGPDSPTWFLLWSADGCAAEAPEAFPLTLAGPSPAGPAAGLGQLDGAPLRLGALAAVLRATQAVAAEEEFMATGGHSITTATYTVRDRQSHGQMLAGLPPVSDAVRLQVARAVCAVLYGRVPNEPVATLLDWQREVGGDRGALVRALRTTAERIEAAASIAQAAAKLAQQPDGQR